MNNHRILLGFINILLGSINLAIYNSMPSASVGFVIVGVFGLLTGFYSLYQGMIKVSN